MLQRLPRGEATIRQEVIAKTIAPLLYALTVVTAAGKGALLAPPLEAVVATTLQAALDHPLAALGLRPPHHGAAARLVAPLLLAVVLEDADNRHF